MRSIRRKLVRAIENLRPTITSYTNNAWFSFDRMEWRPGVLFIGYAEGDLGLGQSFRCNVTAALLAGVPLAVYPFRVGVETRLSGPFLPECYDTTHVHDINFIEVAPDQTPVVFENLDPRLTHQSYNILRTFWELPQAPEAWRPMLKGVHELWAPNDFVADAFREIFPGKIAIIPPAVDTGNGPFERRETFGMEPDRFYFLFSFDYFSSPYRKNPAAVLRAFQEAFAGRADRVGLIIKSIGSVEHFPEIKSVFLEAAKHDPRIIVIDKSLSRNEMLSLIHASDAYISLHRSEGFGSGMAEAMSLGRVVIGTDFSGNTEFLTPETGFPVPYALRRVEPHEYHWSSDQCWAEPHVAEAAAIMRLVIDRPDLTAERTRAGQALMKAKYAPEPVGLAIKRRIEQIDIQLRRGVPPGDVI